MRNHQRSVQMQMPFAAGQVGRDHMPARSRHRLKTCRCLGCIARRYPARPHV